MGTESKKIVKLNGMVMCDEIRAEIEAINSETGADWKKARSKLSELRLNGEVLVGLRDDDNYWWQIFPNRGEDLRFYNFIKEKFPEYLI